MNIYLITNKLNEMKYVGQTHKSIEQRFSSHCNRNSDLNYLQRAINKYGKENFEICLLTTANTSDELNELEIYHIASLNTVYPNGYNLTIGGKGGLKSEETKKNMSLSKIGKPSHRKGIKCSIETRLKMSLARKDKKGWIPSRETIEKRKLKQIGQKRSELSKAKMSLGKLGKSNNHCKVKIISIDKNNIQIGFYSINDASEFFNIKRTSISNALNGWNRTSKGIKFKYYSESEGL